MAASLLIDQIFRLTFPGYLLVGTQATTSVLIREMKAAFQREYLALFSGSGALLITVVISISARFSLLSFSF